MVESGAYEIIGKTFRPGEMTGELRAAVDANVTAALLEDAAADDVSAGSIEPGAETSAVIICREPAVLAGRFWADAVFAKIDAATAVAWRFKDGDRVGAGQKLCTIRGSLRAILSGERSALNFLQTLSATASLTARFVDRLGGAAILLDTRKTLPGLRTAQKYAVACGGGCNHRRDLSTMVLIKDNHVRACGSVARALQLARARHPGLAVEVETQTLDEVSQACDGGADVIMLDNFPAGQITRAVELTAGRSLLEASGNIGLHNLCDIAACGVDFVSVGEITKDIDAIDLTLEICQAGRR